MMRDTIKLDLLYEEKNLILNSLNELRNDLLSQDRDITIINDILIKFIDTNKVELDRYEINIIINALNKVRTDMKNRNEYPRDINELILKLINENSKKKVLSRIMRVDNGRKIR